MTTRHMIPEHVVTISDNDHLTAFCTRMSDAPWIAVDTEFKRERTYYPELCLLQIACCDEIGLIDMLAADELAPLTALFGSGGPLKVFHAADQDLEVLHQALNITPDPVFDTQVAAALTGIGDQIGYAKLVEELTGTALAKAHTRTDWSQRPLSSQELTYAADDVRYLAAIHPLLQERLRELGRMRWAEADCAALNEPGRLSPVPEQAWQRVKGWRKLDPAAQQILAALAEWRESQAMRANRPRKWILPDQAIIDLAHRQPRDQHRLEQTDTVAPKTAGRHGTALLDAIQRGRQRPAAPLAPDTGPMDDEQKKIFKNARRALELCARSIGIPAPTLAKRRELEQLVAGERDLPVLNGWRAEVAGNTIVDVVEGRRRIEGSGASARIVDTPDG